MTIWIKELLKNLDKHVDESTKEKILRACGEKCPFTHLKDERLLEIKASSTSDIDFLNNLCDQWRMVHEEGQFYVVFDQCYCPMVSDNTKGVSRTLCYCTLGNLRHKFSIGLKRKVDVEMLGSILAGDEACRFHVKLQDA